MRNARNESLQAMVHATDRVAAELAAHDVSMARWIRWSARDVLFAASDDEEATLDAARRHEHNLEVCTRHLGATALLLVALSSCHEVRRRFTTHIYTVVRYVMEPCDTGEVSLA